MSKDKCHFEERKGKWSDHMKHERAVSLSNELLLQTRLSEKESKRKSRSA